MTKPIERLDRAYFSNAPMVPTTAPRGSNAVYAGRTTIDSGSASVTVSTAAVNSDSIIMTALSIGSMSAAANSGGGIAVNSIVSGTSFALARPTGVAVPWDDTVMWELKLTS